jgi:hypothetical protein
MILLSLHPVQRTLAKEIDHEMAVVDILLRVHPSVTHEAKVGFGILQVLRALLLRLLVLINTRRGRRRRKRSGIGTGTRDLVLALDLHHLSEAL